MLRGALVIACALVLMQAGGADGSATLPAIHAVRADGTSHRVVGGKVAIAFSLSPDGRTVAFLRRDGERIGLWLARSDGTDERRLLIDTAGEPISEMNPLIWSPRSDALSLTFVDFSGCPPTPNCGSARAVVVDVRDGRRLLSVSGEDLRWSSDGRRRVWGCDLEPDPYGELEALCFTLQPGGAVQRIRSLGLIHRPALSPDGWRVAYSGPGGEYIGVVGLRRRAVLLRHDNSEEPAVDGALSWSPDGRRIAYSAGDAVYALGATGGRARRVAGMGWNPAWSPDGRRIAFVARGLWTSRPDGTGARRVRRSPVQSCGDSFTAPSCGPVWSRDGRMLYYLAPS